MLLALPLIPRTMPAGTHVPGADRRAMCAGGGMPCADCDRARTDAVAIEASKLEGPKCSGSAAELDERQMLPAFEVVDLELDLVAAHTTELGVGRVAGSGLEARQAARRRP